MSKSIRPMAYAAAVMLMTSPVPAISEGIFPVTIEHAFGETTVPTRPVRVATVAWANQEVPLALGIVPVGMAAASFGDDDGNGVLPWVEARLRELGAETPALFDEGDGIDFEAVAAVQPDIILAAYSGLTRAEYDTLSQIAPVIAYPESAWGTDWRETIRTNSVGLGLVTEGDELISRIEDEIASAVARHPDLAGKSAMFVTHLDPTNLSVVNFYTDNDSRVKFFGDLGLVSPSSVIGASKPGEYSGSISAEKIDSFDDVDIVVTYGNQALLTAMKASPLVARMPAVINEGVVMLGRDPLGTAANPTPLSISYVLNDYVDLLADAAKR